MFKKLNNNQTSVKKNKRKSGKTSAPVKALKIFGTFLFSMFLIIVMTGAILLTVLTIYIMNFMDSSVSIDLSDIQQNYMTYIYAKNTKGEWIVYDTISTGGERRTWVNLEEIPQHVRDCFVYSEDANFNSHDGVDFKRTFAAFANLFLHFWDTEQGGSTITQQVIKNITGDDATQGSEGISRKFREIFRAIQVERDNTKDDILEAYLNIIHLANNTNGVQAAANYYFDKDVSELTIAEAASIAAITKSPAANNPLKYPEANRRRQIYILDCLLENGAISSEEYDAALAEELTFIGNSSYGEDEEGNTNNNALSAYDNFDDVSSYYVDAVIEQAISQFQEVYGISREAATTKLYRGGYSIYTNVDLEMQKTVEKGFMDRTTFQKREVEDDQLQAAFICMDYSGKVLAVVGGAGEKQTARGWNYAIDSKRSPGSTIKPLASYGPAVMLDLVTWSTIVEDSPILIPIEPEEGDEDEDAEPEPPMVDENGEIIVPMREWPKNYSNDSSNTAWTHQNYFLHQCLQLSLNTAAAQLIEAVTPYTAYEFLSEKLHISTLTPYSDGRTDIARAPMAVGALTIGSTLQDIVAAYQIYGNNGKYFAPSYISQIVDKNSRVIFEHNPLEEQVMDEASAFVINRMMRTVVTAASGTGRYANLKNVEVAGKTGTAEDWTDLLFMGLTPEYVSGVWLGYDTPSKVPVNTIYYSAAEVWKKTFGTPYADKGAVAEFQMPDTAVRKRYCTFSGLLASGRCKDTDYGYYKESNLPLTCSGDHFGTPDPWFEVPKLPEEEPSEE